MKKYKILALVALCLAAIFALSSCAPSVAGTKKAASDSGTWGENINWEYDAGTQTLSLEGSGAMKEFTSPDEVPWKKANASAVTIIVDLGVASIADYAFYGFSAVESATLPEGLTSVGKLSFGFCGALETLSLPSTLEDIGESAFEWCASLKSVNVGSSLAHLGTRAFAYCRALESAYLCSEGLNIDGEAFKACEKLTTLVVHPADKDKINPLAFDTDFDLSKISSAETANDEVTITVNFVYADGKAAAGTKTETRKLGETYTISVPSIEGYTSDVTEVSGVAGSTNESFTVTYTAIPVETESETEPAETEPKEEEKPLGIFPIILLVVMIAGIGVGAYFLVKSNKKEAERQANQNKAKNRKQK